MNAGVYVEVDSQIKNKYRVEYMIKYAVQIGRKARIYDSSYYNDIYIAKYVGLSLKKYRELINSQYRMNDVTYFKTFEECQEAVDKLYAYVLNHKDDLLVPASGTTIKDTNEDATKIEVNALDDPIWNYTDYNDDSDDDESAGSLALYPNVAAFPAVGEPTAIYVDESTNKMYRWVTDELMYIPIGDGDSAPDIHFIDGGGAFDE